MSSWLSLTLLRSDPTLQTGDRSSFLCDHQQCIQENKNKPAQGVLVFSAGRDLRMNMGRTFVTGYARSCVNTPNGRQVESSEAVVGGVW